MNVQSNETMLIEEEVNKTNQEVEEDNVSRNITVDWDQWDGLLLTSLLDSGVHSLDTVYDRTTVMIEQDPVGSRTDNKLEDLMMYLDEGCETEDRGGLGKTTGRPCHRGTSTTPSPRTRSGSASTLVPQPCPGTSRGPPSHFTECPDTHHNEVKRYQCLYEDLQHSREPVDPPEERQRRAHVCLQPVGL